MSEGQCSTGAVAGTEGPRMTPRPGAVLVGIFTVSAGGLQGLLIRRSAEPFKDALSLPGGLLNPGESLQDAAVRKLDDERGLTDVFLEKLYTFSDLDGRGADAGAYFPLPHASATHPARQHELLA